MTRDEMMRHEVFRRLVAAELPASAEDVDALVDQVRDTVRDDLLTEARELEGCHKRDDCLAQAVVYYTLAEEIRRGGA